MCLILLGLCFKRSFFPVLVCSLIVIPIMTLYCLRTTCVRLYLDVHTCGSMFGLCLVIVVSSSSSIIMYSTYFVF